LSDEGLLAAAIAVRMDAAGRDPSLLGLPIAGIGWATVELERAAADLDAAFQRVGMPKPAWVSGTRDELLGAAAWISREWWPTGASDEPPAVVLLEPDTEGRLSAALARAGEGVAAIYLAPRADEGDGARHRIDSRRVGRPSPGPLGSGRLVLARPSWGPHVIVLDRPLPERRP
jgi:hypothetical protein